MPNLTNIQEPEPFFFGPLEPEPLEKIKTGAGAAWEKNQESEPEPLEKKSGAAKKFACSPALGVGVLDGTIMNPCRCAGWYYNEPL